MTLLIDRLPEQISFAQPVDELFLSFEERQQHRARFVTASGRQVALSLPRGTKLVDGTIIHKDGNSTIVIRCKHETVLVASPADIPTLASLCHHLGNWHRTAMLLEDNSVATIDDAPLQSWLTERQIAFNIVEMPYEPNLISAAHD